MVQCSYLINYFYLNSIDVFLIKKRNYNDNFRELKMLKINIILWNNTIAKNFL